MPASPLRRSATMALLKAAEYIDRFGWDAPSPSISLPSIRAHLNVAACSVAATTGQPVYDIEALAAHLLAETLRDGADWRGLVEWECEPGRTTEDVTAAMYAAASEMTETRAA